MGGRVNTEARIHDAAVKEALIVVWGTADRIRGKRLKSILPMFVGFMGRHSHLDLDQDAQARLL